MPDLKLEEEEKYQLPQQISNNDVILNTQQMGV